MGFHLFKVLISGIRSERLNLRLHGHFLLLLLTNL